MSVIIFMSSTDSKMNFERICLVFLALSLELQSWLVDTDVYTTVFKMEAEFSILTSRTHLEDHSEGHFKCLG